MSEKNGKSREKDGLSILTNYIDDASSLNIILEEKETDDKEDKAYKERLDNLLTNIFTIRKSLTLLLKKYI